MGFTSQAAPVPEPAEHRQGSGVSEQEFQAALLNWQAEPGAITLLVTITSIRQRLPGEEPWQRPAPRSFVISTPITPQCQAIGRRSPNRGEAERALQVCGDSH